MEAEKFNLKRFGITFFIVFLIAGVTAGSIWYLMDQKLQDQKSEYDTKISDLQRKVDGLSNTENKDNNESSDFKNYDNGTFNFSFKYPKEWTLYDKLPNTVEQDISPNESISVEAKNFNFSIWVNPAGFGFGEGSSLGASYKSAVSGGSIILGERDYYESEDGDNQFSISTGFESSGKKFVIHCYGDKQYFPEAEEAFKDLVKYFAVN